MFTLNWKWSTFLGETGAAFVTRLRKRTTGIKPTNDYTDAQVTEAVDVVGQLTSCKPMNSNELDPDLITSICKKIKQGRELDARQAIETAATPEARRWCIAALKSAATDLAHALEDYACKDYPCMTLDGIAATCDGVAAVVSFIPGCTKIFAITTASSCFCRTLRNKCKEAKGLFGCN